MDDKLPPPIKVTHGDNSNNDGSNPKDDDSLIKAGFEVKNPFQKFFEWIKNFIKKNQNITIKIPIIGVFVALSSFSVGLGSGYNWGFNVALAKLFPNSSPVFHRSISLEGIIQKSDSEKYYLKTENNLWVLKTVKPNVNLANYLNKQVQIFGNLTKEINTVEVSEIIPLDSQASQTPPGNPDNPNPAPSGAGLPTLFSALDWQTTQKRVLIFTSGKRKIEQMGVYLESSQLSVFPQDFINYYIQELKNKDFKETLNSISPDGVTITYAKNDLFLTFGTKNIYAGTGEKKQLAGYKVFIEHN